ncbi:hypothetical protein ZWY2020_056720 [Hordeum vulgare]|nr:hypothetical protein ZWY2020_056720 [Hordeum vulgare]
MNTLASPAGTIPRKCATASRHSVGSAGLAEDGLELAPRHGPIRLVAELHHASPVEVVPCGALEGKKQTRACSSLQYLSLYGCSVAYTITTATSIRAILKANYYHVHGHDAPCSFDGSYYMLMFGGAQLLLSFIPDLHDMAWLSVVAVVMSFSYAFIGLGLGLSSTICKYYALLLFRPSQDTLKSPPAENKTMNKASIISILVTTFFYLCCGCFGYAGSDSRNLLTGFGFYEPYWGDLLEKGHA